MMQVATEAKVNGLAGSKKLTVNTVFVFYGDHDKGSPDGMIVREGVERASRTAKILAECGYRKIYQKPASSVVGQSFYDR